jgi:hypothetical protein
METVKIVRIICFYKSSICVAIPNAIQINQVGIDVLNFHQAHFRLADQMSITAAGFLNKIPHEWRFILRNKMDLS